MSKKAEDIAAEWLTEHGLENALLRIRQRVRCLLEAGAIPSYLTLWTKVEAILQAHQKRFLKEASILYPAAPEAKSCPGCGRPGRECWGSPCLYLEFVKARPLTELREWCKTTGGTLVSRQDAQ